MSYAGDIRLGDTIDVQFTTRRFSTGAPFALSGGTIAAYIDNSTTEITSGITLTADLDGRTGLNNVRVVASGGNGFTTGTNVHLVITAGTVDSVSVVGEVVGSFSIEKRSALMPTTGGRTLDVTAGGNAGIDWANVETPGSTVALSATTVATATSVTNNVNAVLANTAHGGTSTTLTFERFVGASTTSNEPCVKLTGNGTGAGLRARGGSSGAGAEFVAGAVGGTYGLDVTGGFQAAARFFAAQSNGVEMTGDAGGGAYGLALSGTSGGLGGSVVGNIAGNLSGSVGSVATNGVTAASLAADAGTEIGTAVWATATRTLTAATNITSTGGTTVPQTGDSYAIVNSGTHGNAALKTLVDALTTALAAVAADLPGRITKNVALSAFPFKMVLSSDHVTAATGKTVTATRSLDGAAFAACANSVTEIANGWYKIDLAATDLNANTVALRFTASDCDATEVTIVTQVT